MHSFYSLDFWNESQTIWDEHFNYNQVETHLQLNCKSNSCILIANKLQTNVRLVKPRPKLIIYLVEV